VKEDGAGADGADDANDDGDGNYDAAEVAMLIEGDGESMGKKIV
jgi:hypothetical protein